MHINIDKRTRSNLFQNRLMQAMGEQGETQSGLARKVGVDRSTISQLLTNTGARLPNAQVVAECAHALHVSADWLLGLSERPESASSLLATSLELTNAARALIDDQIFEWHKQAQGYKIRHVPATLPDMLKTNQMLEWEYSEHLGRTSADAINAARDRLDWMSAANSDFEIVIAQHELDSMCRAEGYYRTLPSAVRIEQIKRMIDLIENLYPRMRVYVYDARMLYSSPMTVFGPQLAVLYLGQNYMAFRDSQRIDGFANHFDRIVREARITSREFSPFLSKFLQP